MKDFSLLLSDNSFGRLTSPLSLKINILMELTVHTMEGTIRELQCIFSLTCPPIHNIIVVTSPIGDHAPPALAARIIIHQTTKCFLVFNKFFRRAAITIAVVKLSKTAEKKNVITLNIQIK